MNIFLPYENNINKSVESLDDKRLIKQILECYQLVQIYEKEKSGIKLSGVGYHNHPIYKHYSKYPNFMYMYGYVCCCEYYYRFQNHHNYEEYFTNMVNWNNAVVNYDYVPFYMEGSKGQYNYIRTTENVSSLYQHKLKLKWLNDKYKVKWTNRNTPKFICLS